MPRRCLATAAMEQIYPYHEPRSISAHRRRILRRASGGVLDLSSRWVANRDLYLAGAVDSLTVLGFPGRAGVPRGSVEGHAPMPTEILGGTLDTAEPPSGAFDTVVSTLALCTAADLDFTLSAVAGWLRPGGRLLVLEHVLGSGFTGLAQRLVGPVGGAASTACRIDNDLAAALRRAGFELIDAARFTAWLAAGVPTPCLAGVARLHRAPPLPNTPGAP